MREFMGPRTPYKSGGTIKWIILLFIIASIIAGSVVLSQKK